MESKITFEIDKKMNLKNFKYNNLVIFEKIEFNFFRHKIIENKIINNQKYTFQPMIKDLFLAESNIIKKFKKNIKTFFINFKLKSISNSKIKINFVVIIIVKDNLIIFEYKLNSNNKFFLGIKTNFYYQDKDYIGDISPSFDSKIIYHNFKDQVPLKKAGYRMFSSFECVEQKSHSFAIYPSVDLSRKKFLYKWEVSNNNKNFNTIKIEFD